MRLLYQKQYVYTIENTPQTREVFSMARPTGFEPAISSVTGRRDRPASLRAQTIQCALYIIT